MSHNLILENVLTELEEADIKNLDFSELENLVSEEDVWLEEKKKRFSASEAHRLMGFDEKPDFPDGAETYVVEKVLDMVTDAPQKKDLKGLPAIAWGKANEKEAMTEFQKQTGIIVDYFGKDQYFVIVSDHICFTPDGFISTDGGVETKCPDSKTHYYYMRFLNPDTIKKLYKEVYWQMQFSMKYSDRQYWYFVSYDPRFKNPAKRLFYFKVERNEEDIKKLDRRVFMGIRSKQKHLEYLS